MDKNTEKVKKLGLEDKRPLPGIKKPGLGVRILLSPEIGVLIPILVLCVVTTMIKPSFLTWRYIASILTGCVFIGAAALGETLIIMAGEIDLSVGLNGCLAGVIFGMAASEWGLGTFASIALCLLAGAFVGWINGFFICKLGLHSWITTLATQFICQGIAVTIGQGVPRSIKALGISGFTRAKPLGLNWLFFIFIALLILLDVLLRRTRYGYQLRAVGGNKEAAQMAGINVKRVKWVAFILAGLLAAVGGMFDVLNSGVASDTYGVGREFRAIICCAIGGISMAGGAGSAFGTGLGVLLFHTLWYCLRILNVDTNLQLVLIGLILVLAVLLDIKRKQLETKRSI